MEKEYNCKRDYKYTLYILQAERGWGMRMMRRRVVTRDWKNKKKRLAFEEEYRKYKKYIESHEKLLVQRRENNNCPPSILVYCKICRKSVGGRGTEKYFRVDIAEQHLKSNAHKKMEEEGRNQKSMRMFMEGSQEVYKKHDSELKKSRTCIGFGHRMGLKKGSDSLSKKGRLFRIEPRFEAIDPMTGDRIIGTAFGCGMYECERITHEKSGVCEKCQEAEKTKIVRKTISQRKYQAAQEEKIALRKAKKKKELNVRCGKKRRAVGSPAGSPGAKKYTPLKYYSCSEREVVIRERESYRTQKEKEYAYRESAEMKESIRSGNFANYILNKSKYLEENSEKRTMVLQGTMCAIGNNILKTKGPGGMRYAEALKDLAVLILNRSRSSYEILTANVPGLLPSISSAERYARKWKAELTREDGVVGILEESSDIYRKLCLEKGWKTQEGKIGPCQICMDSTRVREIVMPDVKRKTMIGFAAKKMGESWIFENEYNEDILSIARAFEKEEKAGYVMLGLICALTPHIPPMPLLIIPHTNKYKVEALSEWVEMGLESCSIGGIPIVKIAGDGDSKNMCLFEERCKKASSASIGLDVPGWFVWANRDDKYEVTIGLDPRHGLRNGRVQLLKYNKLLMTPVGQISLQHIMEAANQSGSHIYNSMFDPYDKTNQQAAEDVVAGYNRRAVYREGMNQYIELEDGMDKMPQQFMATVVYMYVNDMINKVYSDDQLPICDRVMLCGMVYQFTYGWRTWLMYAKEYGLTLKENFLTIQQTKFLLIQAQGFVTRLLTHIKHFNDLPFYPQMDGSDQCENYFRDLKAKKGGMFCVKDISDLTTKFTISNLIKYKGNVVSDQSSRINELDNSIYEHYPNSMEEVKWLFHRGQRKGNVLLKLLRMHDELEILGKLTEPDIPQWRSTKGMREEGNNGNIDREIKKKKRNDRREDNEEEEEEEEEDEYEDEEQECVEQCMKKYKDNLNNQDIKREMEKVAEWVANKEDQRKQDGSKEAGSRSKTIKAEKEEECQGKNKRKRTEDDIGRKEARKQNECVDKEGHTSCNYMNDIKSIRCRTQRIISTGILEGMKDLIKCVEKVKEKCHPGMEGALESLMDELHVLDELIPDEDFMEKRKVRCSAGTEEVVDEMERKFHPSTVCSIHSRMKDVLPEGVDRLSKWKMSQEWLKKIQRPACIGSIRHGKSIAYHKTSTEWTIGRVESTMVKNGRHYHVTSSISGKTKEAYMIVREFVMENKTKDEREPESRVELTNVPVFVPVECVFLVGVKMCKEEKKVGVYYIREKEYHELARKAERRKEYMEETKIYKYNEKEYKERYIQGQLRELTIDKLRLYLMENKLPVMGCKKEKVERVRSHLQNKYTKEKGMQILKKKVALFSSSNRKMPTVEVEHTVVGSYHQGSERFDGELRGTQCTTMGYIAMVYALKKNVWNWTTQDLDKILDMGNELHKNVEKDIKTNYAIPDKLPRKYMMEGRVYAIDVRNECFGDIFAESERLDRGEVGEKLLHEALVENIEAGRNACFLIYDNLTVTIFGLDEERYRYAMFDSHSRSKEGEGIPNGKSVLLFFKCARALVEHIRMFVTRCHKQDTSKFGNYYIYQTHGELVQDTDGVTKEGRCEDEEEIDIDDEEEEMIEIDVEEKIDSFRADYATRKIGKKDKE